MEVDYIIVGQGLGGTLLGNYLQKAGKRILFVDQGLEKSATKVAAGIFNPITGRRFVKSWMVDELFPYAQELYAELEEELGVKIYHDTNITRALFNHVEENQWMMRSDLPENVPYVDETVSFQHYDKKVVKPYSYFELKNAGRADIFTMVKAFRKKWKKESLLLEESFDFDKIEFQEEAVSYKGNKAGRIIFCEGYLARNNPYFSYLKHNPAKGEVLIVRIPNLSFEKILKHKLYIVPLGDDLYWVGATNEWKEVDCITTEKNRNYLENRLSSFLEIPFEIVEHQAAVRPTVKDRRPYLGMHPRYPQLGIFNGLGTKGASLGPYWANEMAAFLLSGKELNPLVDISRMGE